MTTEHSAQCPTNRSYCHYDVASWLDWMKQQVLQEWWHSLGGLPPSMGEPGGRTERWGAGVAAERGAARPSTHLTLSLQSISAFFSKKHLLTYEFLFQSRKMRGKIFLDFLYETEVLACMQEKRSRLHRHFGDA